MSSFPCIYFLIFSILISLSSSQSTICVWNSVDTRDHYNGEYTISTPATWRHKPYWTKSSTNCPSNYYMFYANETGWEGNWWMLDNYLHIEYINNRPYCESPTPENPTLCTEGWFYWAAGQDTWKTLNIKVTDGACPSLQCKKMRLSNSGDGQCNNIFVRDTTKDNVFVNGGIYLYFNKNTFKWYCSTTLVHEECGDDDDITHFTVSSDDDDLWEDVNDGESFQRRLNNGRTATFECIGPTSSPTTDPTGDPTKDPTADPTKDPTVDPSNAPTKAPTNDPTQIPSSSPTTPFPTDTTSLPTRSPTDNPTTNPTMDPTSHPTTNPTVVPTSGPSTDPTTNPTKDPTSHPTTNPTAVPSSSPTTEKEKIVVEVDKSTKPADDVSGVAGDATTANPVDMNGINNNETGNDKQNEGDNFFDNLTMVYVIGGALLLITLLTICMILMYCRERKRSEHNKITNDHATASKIRVASIEMPSAKNSINLCEFAAATTPNLTSLNNTMSDMAVINGEQTLGMDTMDRSSMMNDSRSSLQKLNLGITTKGMDPVDQILNKMGGKLQKQNISNTDVNLFAVSSVSSAGSPVMHNEQKNIEMAEGDSYSDDGDELYETGLKRIVTVGGPDQIDHAQLDEDEEDEDEDEDDNNNDDESIDDNHDAMYIKPDGQDDIVTVGMDDNENNDFVIRK